MGMICYVRATNEAERKSLADDPEQIEELVDFGTHSGALSLEKSWHGLHYLLTGTAEEGKEPLGFLVAGGEEIGEDLGYGPARMLDAQKVKELNRALALISDAELDRRFDLEALADNQVYPFIWDESREDLLQEYLGYFHQLKQYVDQTGRQNNGLLVLLA
jgi:hypothetical protein